MGKRALATKALAILFDICDLHLKNKKWTEAE